jgi:nitroimidazol reductase NimA-like FMN-containing flavoprotein (pyridoxamine 5'-phosphate oxidase superfamily)
MKISTKSPWAQKEIEQFLAEAKTPMRLAFNDRDGFPAVCSLWFYFDEGSFWAASHKTAHMVKMLKQNSKVSVEVATNEYPYKGVRAKANVELSVDGADKVLQRLISRYLVDGNNKLADWLLSRVADEYVLKITPRIVNAWDFSNRMDKD